MAMKYGHLMLDPLVNDHVLVAVAHWICTRTAHTQSYGDTAHARTPSGEQ
jgi:hypothetical protein